MYTYVYICFSYACMRGNSSYQALAQSSQDSESSMMILSWGSEWHSAVGLRAESIPKHANNGHEKTGRKAFYLSIHQSGEKWDRRPPS